MRITKQQREFIDKVFQEGVEIRCPHCGVIRTIYHYRWTALSCATCWTDNNLQDWRIV